VNNINLNHIADENTSRIHLVRFWFQFSLFQLQMFYLR